MDELKSFLERPDAHRSEMADQLNAHLRRVALALVSEMADSIPANGREQWIREWLAGRLTDVWGLLWAADVEDMVDHILVAIGRRSANGDTLGYLSYDSFVVHGWRSCPRLWGRSWRITTMDGPRLLIDEEKCRFCWSEEDRQRLEKARGGHE